MKLTPWRCEIDVVRTRGASGWRETHRNRRSPNVKHRTPSSGQSRRTWTHLACCSYKEENPCSSSMVWANEGGVVRKCNVIPKTCGCRRVRHSLAIADGASTSMRKSTWAKYTRDSVVLSLVEAGHWSTGCWPW